MGNFGVTAEFLLSLINETGSHFREKELLTRVCPLVSGKLVRGTGQRVFQVEDDTAEAIGVMGGGGSVSWLEIIKIRKAK